MFSDLANFLMAFLFNTKFDVVGVDDFIGNVYGSFYNVRYMVFDELDVSTRSVTFVRNLLCVRDGKHLGIGDIAFHQSDWVLPRCCNYFSFRGINGYRAKASY